MSIFLKIFREEFSYNFYLSTLLNYPHLPERVKGFIFHFIGTNRLLQYSKMVFMLLFIRIIPRLLSTLELCIMQREKEVVKEEGRQRYDVNPLGRIPERMQAIDHENYSYRWPVIGSMDHLDAASLDDFKDFFNRYYIPNNACHVLTGDVDIAEAKKYIKTYFERIPRGRSVIQPPYISGTSESRIIRDSIKGIKDFLNYNSIAKSSAKVSS